VGRYKINTQEIVEYCKIVDKKKGFKGSFQQSFSDVPGPSTNERGWIQYLAKNMKDAQPEFETPDGSFADIVDEEFAIEVEWIKKWKESIGQAVLYGLMLNKRPKVIYLTRGHKEEDKYILRAQMVCKALNIAVEYFPTTSKNERSESMRRNILRGPSSKIGFSANN
jgi:hypothetical protein